MDIMKKLVLVLIPMFCLLYASGQYMSFFGDSTWEYHITYITNPPEDYVNYPPEEPNELGVYCKTYIYRFDKSHYSYVWHGYLVDESNYAYPNWLPGMKFLTEDTSTGRLYSSSGYVCCDMSLTVGDTFVLTEQGLDSGSLIEPVGDRNMIVDSVRYIDGRKTIFLSLLDHQNDFFFGSESPLQSFKFSIRFIEGIGASYGLWPETSDLTWGPGLHHPPLMTLMQCVYKDDSLVYMADERLGCDQTCVGLNDYLQSYMNLYPNPASSYLVLDMGTGEEMDGDVMIADMMGRVCLQQHIAGLSNRISVAGLPPGMYFLTYIHEQRIITRKFIKE